MPAQGNSGSEKFPDPQLLTLHCLLEGPRVRILCPSLSAPQTLIASRTRPAQSLAQEVTGAAQAVTSRWVPDSTEKGDLRAQGTQLSHRALLRAQDTRAPHCHTLRSLLPGQTLQLSPTQPKPSLLLPPGRAKDEHSHLLTREREQLPVPPLLAPCPSAAPSGQS